MNQDSHAPSRDIEAELEATTAELNELVYVVSHDLRAPMRAILHCLELMQRRFGEELPEDAVMLLNRAMDSSSHGHTMLDALLIYSRLTTRREPPTIITSDDMIDRIMRELEKAIALRQAIIQVEKPLPLLYGDRKQIRQLISQLLSNAIMHSNPNGETAIRVWGKTDGDQVELTISDNGIGLNDEEQWRALKMFKQLQPSQEKAPEGILNVGMGLPIASKVVNLHHGELRIHSQPGQGTSVTVSMPAPPEDANQNPSLIHIRHAGSSAPIVHPD